MKFCVRQGDVLIEKVRSIPKSAKPLEAKGGRVVLAEGEATGHAHTMFGGSATLLEDDGAMFLAVEHDDMLTHQEHGEIEVPAGKYRVTRQREYSPLEVRNVAD